MNPSPPPGAARPRAVLYLRQSVAREESISLEVQETSGRAYSTQQGYDVVAVESDPGISGRTWNRPAVQRVMTMIETGAADVVILWKWSRLSRSRLDWAVAVDKVESAGGRIESATESVDVSTSTGRLARGMLAEFAAFESERIGDTWKQAHERRVKQGRPANGKPRFGYRYDPDTQDFHPDPETGPILVELYQRYISGEPMTGLARWLNLHGVQSVMGNPWTPVTVRQMMDRGFATGTFVRHGERLEGVHEALISWDTWEEYQARRKVRRASKWEGSKKLLSGLVRCYCGARMHSGSQVRYSCAGYLEQQVRPHPGRLSVMQTTVEDAVMAWLREVAAEIDAAAPKQPARPSAGPRPDVLQRKLMKLQNRLDTLTVRYLDGEVDRETYERIKTTTKAESAELEDQLRELNVQDRNPVGDLIPDLLRDWDGLSVGVRRDMLSRLIHPVIVGDGYGRSGTILVRGLWEPRPTPADLG